MGQHLPKRIFTLLLLTAAYLPLISQSYQMDGTPINDCSGFFQDSGGGTAGFGTNENFTTVICPDGTSGTHIQLVFSGIDIGPNDLIIFYDDDGPTPGTQLDASFLNSPDNPFIVQATAANPTGCLTIVFQSDAIDSGESGWSADINCITNCQLITAELVSTTPDVMPVDTGWIDICPGERVEFLGQGIYPQNGIVYQHSDLTSTFEWDFGNGETAVGPNVTHVFEEPGGYVVQLAIIDQMDCKNTNFISQRVRVAPYPSFEYDGMVDPTLCSGDSLTISSSIDQLSGSNVIATPDTASFTQERSRSDTLLLPDGSGGQYQESINFTEFSPGATLTNPADICFVSLDLEHSYSGDLDIELVCPDGNSIFLLDFPSGTGSTNFGEPWATGPVDGASGNLTPGVPYTYSFVEGAGNGTLVQFDNNGPPTYTYTTVPDPGGVTHTYTDTYFPPGDYQPEESYANLLGCPLNGEWTIRVTDNLGLDNGWLFGWSIAFKDYLYPEIEVFSPPFMDWGWETNPTVISSDQDELEASPINAGAAAYTFWVEDEFGCRNDTTLNFEVLPPTHPDCFNCDLQFNEQPDAFLCEGDVANFDVTQTTPVEVPITFERFPQYAIGNGNHPPGNGYLSTLNINSLNPGTITDPFVDIESVCFSLSTDFLSDINVVLVSPTGAQLPLALQNGANSMDGYVNTCFTPEELVSINAGAPPYTGNWRPEGNWNVLTGSPINGAWSLLITDSNVPTEFGELVEWSITFNTQNEYTYSWTPAVGLDCTDCPTPTANPTMSTLYEVLIEDPYGCSVVDSVFVGVVADVPAPNVTCQEIDDTILFSWDPIPGVITYEYQITRPSGPEGWIGPITDTEVLVTNLNNGDVISIEVRALFQGAPIDCDVPIGTTSCTSTFCGLEIGTPTVTDATCFSLANGSLEATIIAGQAPYTITIGGQVFQGTSVPDLTAGTYDYIVGDANGCTVNDMFTVNSPDSLFANATQTFQSCNGLDESIAEVVAGGGGGSYTYSWNDSQSQNTAAASNLSPNNYEVLVTDNMGCEVTATVAVQELEPVSFNFLLRPPTCNGFADGGVGVNQVMGGLGTIDTDYTYTWEDGSGGLVRNDLPGGVTYSVTVSDTQGCSAEQSRDMLDPDPVSFDFLTVEPSCFQFGDGTAEVVNIQGPNNGPYTIQWDAQAGSQITALAIDLLAGTYSATVEDEEGCTGAESVDLSQPDGLNLDFSVEDNDCFGYNDGAIGTIVSGGVPTYTFAWSTGQSTAQLENLVAGDYEVTVTDANDCETIRTATVDQPIELIANVEATAVSCFGDRDGMLTILTDGGTPPFQYSLDNQNFIGSNTLIGLEGGNYNIFIRDVNGCQFLTTAVIDEPAELTVDAGPDDTIIFGDSIQLAAVPINPQGLVEYVWDAPYEGTLSCNECEKPFASPEFTIDYEIYIIDENGCDATDRIRIFVDKPKLAVVPTGFTPNNDMVNDRLLVHGRPGTQVLLFQIFDRWGEMVYSAGNFPVNDPETGWDGTYRDQILNSGVFVWSLTVRHEDGSEEVLKGQTTLIR
ncbi:MAG: proprotein convertase P-domain-containing protein [Bacteroidota bacterium]